MVRSIYKTLTQYQDVGGDMVDRVKKMAVYPIFQPLEEAYIITAGRHDYFNKALFYILLAYSRESDDITEGVSWGENKAAIARKLKIEDDWSLYNDLVNLRHPAVSLSISRYLDWQGSATWSHLMMLKDVYEEMKDSARSRILNAQGLIDYDQKYKNSEYAKRLYVEIGEWEQRVNDEENSNKAAVTEIRKRKTKQSERYTLRLEDVLAEVLNTGEPDKPD